MFRPSNTNRPTSTSNGRNAGASSSSSRTLPNGSRPAQSFSRVLSLKKDFEEDKEERKVIELDQDEDEFPEWGSSPVQSAPTQRSKSPPSRAAAQSRVAPVPAGMNPEHWHAMSPADRRKYAMRMAMRDQSSLTGIMPSASSSSSSSSRSNASSSTLYQSTQAYGATSTSNRYPLQELPSLPEDGHLAELGKKRAMPWEADSQPKKVARPAERTGSARSTTLNIKQKISLSTEQQQVLQLVSEGKSIFFTGSAVLLREIIATLRKKFVTAPDAVAVTASTGIAACNIGGVTLHSFGGCGLAIEPIETCIAKLRKNKKGMARWMRTKVLIIDEVSMVEGDLFDKFCKIGQKVRKSTKPFGGIQIIVTGDFFQLPPVTKNNAAPKFCFDADTWAETISMSVNLTKVFRQKDQRFVDMLNEMRFGQLSSTSIEAFQRLARPVRYDDGIEPTELFPRREDVDRSNGGRLRSLNTDGWSYPATDGGALTDPAQRDKQLANFMAPSLLELKVDAQVMLIKNVDETLVNGSMGKVIGFCHKGLYEADPSGRWLREDDLFANADEEERERRMRGREVYLTKIAPGTRPLPIVQFKVPGGGTRDMLVEQDTWKSELPNGEVQVSRAQLPLILAWAMSIHKSQGQTLDRVKVDLGKVFEKGQAYVALSRATSLEGLQVTGFSAQKVMAHRRVAEWSKTLRSLND